MNITYKETPWPHFVGSLDEEMYYHAFKLWETDEKLKSYNISKNRSNIEITDRKLINYLTNRINHLPINKLIISCYHYISP